MKTMMMMMRIATVLAAGPSSIIAAATLATPAWAQPADLADFPLQLESKTIQGTDEQILVGQYAVYENRTSREGKMIHLDIVVLPARSENPKPDPIFWIAGGPGQAAATLWQRSLNDWMREDRDMVFVNQRGTGGDNALRCDITGHDDDIQTYLDPLFDPDAFRRCAEQLGETFDLRMYSTPIAMDDLNEIREALGYETINLVGGSYGTRASLIYLRRHPDTVRSVILNGVAPVSFLNPLYHAREAQRALDLIFDACAADPACTDAFPDLRHQFDTIMSRLDEGPVMTRVQHPTTGQPVEVRLSKAGFTGALRVLTYYDISQIPMHINDAFNGDFETFAQRGVAQARGLRQSIALGMLLSVTCGEDVVRIDPDSIDELTRGTYYGDARVRAQIAVCEFWPKSDPGEDYGEPVSADVPVLLLSGTYDPVTPPSWAVDAARHLPQSLHIEVPGSHGVSSPCLTEIQHAFLERASVDELDIECVNTMRRSAFDLPQKDQ